MAKLTGQCLCRSVICEVADQVVYSMKHHCSDCRRATGSAIKPFAGIAIEKLRLINGQDSLMKNGGDRAHAVHCARCGTLPYSLVGQGNHAHVTLGKLVDTPSIRPIEPILAGIKARWSEITDDLPQNDELEWFEGLINHDSRACVSILFQQTKS